MAFFVLMILFLGGRKVALKEGSVLVGLFPGYHDALCCGFRVLWCSGGFVN